MFAQVRRRGAIIATSKTMAAGALVLSVTCGSTAQAQQASGAAAPAASPFRLERFAEDWFSMADETARTRPWHGLKWIELGEARVTLGGDFRLRSEFVDAPLLGATGARADSYLLRRAMLHADVRLNPVARAFIQVSHHRAYGRKLPFPLDRDGFEFQQAFLELTRASPKGTIAVRAGRQEIILSSRFLHPREATNIRSAYDGIRAWAQHGFWRVEGFVTRPVQSRPGALDNRGNPAERFDGVRLTRTFGAKGAWRLIGSWYRQQREAFRIGSASGPDDRTSWGLRLAGREGAFDFDAEHYIQAGQFAGQRISAFGGGGEGGFAPPGSSRPRLGMRWLYGSGDGDAGDNRSGTFAGPFPRPPCCIDPLWLAPSNLAVLTPFVQITPHRDVMVEGKADFVRRLRGSDAIYAFPQTAYPGSVGRVGDNLGGAVGVSVTWTPVPEMSVGVQHLEQSAQGAFAEAGARDGRYTAASIAIRF